MPIKESETNSNAFQVDIDKSPFQEFSAELIPHSLPRTKETISELPKDSQFLAQQTLKNSDLIPEFDSLIEIFNDYSEDATRTFYKHLGARQSAVGKMFEYFADTYLRLTAGPGEEIISPQQVSELYSTNKLKKGLKMRNHAEFDLLVVQKNNNFTEIVKGCEATAVRRISENTTKQKQKTHHNNGKCIQDLLLDNEENWIETLGEIFNGHYPHLPREVIVDHANFNTALLLPELEDKRNMENGLEDYEGEIIRVPINRTQISNFIDALTKDLDVRVSFLNPHPKCYN